jgi:hypothetical protein
MTAPRSPIAKPKPQAGTRQGNGRLVLSGVDGRTTSARRFKEIIASLSADLGGDLTEAQKAIAARAATMAVWCEQAETEFANGGDFDVTTFATVANALRRLLADLGLERRARDVTPSLDAYLKGKAVTNV